MDAGERKAESSWWNSTRGWIRNGLQPKSNAPKIGLALGGGFARGIAHVGVLRALEKNNIPIYAISGVSAGSMVAAAFASGATSDEIEATALSMKFRDVAKWTLNLMGLADSNRMIQFLGKLLKENRFEDMKLPLAIVATDLRTARPVTFHGKGSVLEPIRASCSYPGLFQPLRYDGKLLVDGFVSMEVPAEPLLQLGCNRIISVNIPNQEGVLEYGNMLSVISRCFQIMSSHSENSWRRYSNVVITPPVANVGWDSFISAKSMIALGEESAMAAMPVIRNWLSPEKVKDRGAASVRIRQSQLAS